MVGMDQQNLNVEAGFKEEEIMKMLFGEDVAGLISDSFDGSTDEHQIFMEVFYGRELSRNSIGDFNFKHKAAGSGSVFSKVSFVDPCVTSKPDGDLISSKPSKSVLNSPTQFPLRIVESFGNGILSSCYCLNLETDSDDLCNFNVLTVKNDCASPNTDGQIVSEANIVNSPFSQDAPACKISPLDGVPKLLPPVNHGVNECGLVEKENAGITRDKDFIKDLPTHLQSHAHSLLKDAGWKIEPRKRCDRAKLASFFIDPNGEHPPLKALSQVWKICGEKLFTEAIDVDQVKHAREWTDIDTFWADLADVLEFIEKRILHLENSLSLLSRWKLLDPFMAVLWIDKKIGALRAGKSLKAIDSSAFLMNSEKCKATGPKCRDSHGQMIIASESYCNKKAVKGKSLQYKEGRKGKNDLQISEPSSFREGFSFSFTKGCPSNIASTPVFASQDACTLVPYTVKKDEISSSEKFFVFDGSEQISFMSSHNETSGSDKFALNENSSQGSSLLLGKTSSEEGFLKQLELQFSVCQATVEEKKCTFGDSELSGTSSYKRISSSLKRPPKKSRKISEIPSGEAKTEDAKPEPCNLNGRECSLDRCADSLEVSLESTVEYMQSSSLFTSPKEIKVYKNFVHSELEDERLAKHANDNGHANHNNESAGSCSLFDSTRDNSAPPESTKGNSNTRNFTSRSKKVQVNSNFQEEGGDGNIGMEAVLPSEPPTSLKSNKSKKYEVRKDNGRKKPRITRINDNDLLISAIIRNKDFSGGNTQFSKVNVSYSKPLGRFKSQKGGHKLLLRNPGKGGKSSDGKRFILGARTIICWLIKKGALSLKDVVQYRDPRSNSVVKDGTMTLDGILCSCCSEVFSLSDFKTHAGSSLQRASANLFLQSGRPYILCQLQAWSAEYKMRRASVKVAEVEEVDQNDDTCGLCGDGGELICCDNCPSTYHQACLPKQELPEGNWYCFNCLCAVCKEVVNAKDDQNSLSFLRCLQCEHKYHLSCLGIRSTCNKVSDSQECFCGRECQEVYMGLRSRVGFKNFFGDGFSWSILRCSHGDLKVQSAHKIALVAEVNAKLAISLVLMEECFLPMVDPRTGIDMIPHVLYNMGSNFARLNYQGFYTFVMEKGDELISVASIRVHGVRLAEMPLVATSSEHRRRGMCRQLMKAIVEMLKAFKVKMLVLSAIPSLLDTWTSGFGFTQITDDDREKLCDVNLMLFPGTILLKKNLLETVDELFGDTGLVDDFPSRIDQPLEEADRECLEMDAYDVKSESLLQSSIEPSPHEADWPANPIPASFDDHLDIFFLDTQGAQVNGHSFGTSSIKYPSSEELTSGKSNVTMQYIDGKVLRNIIISKEDLATVQLQDEKGTTTGGVDFQQKNSSEEPLDLKSIVNRSSQSTCELNQGDGYWDIS